MALIFKERVNARSPVIQFTERKWNVMKPLEILEWTMGWAWPVIVGFFVLIMLGIVRLINWDTQKLYRNITSIAVQRDAKTYERNSSVTKYMSNVNRLKHYEQNGSKAAKRQARNSSIPRRRIG